MRKQINKLNKIPKEQSKNSLWDNLKFDGALVDY